MKKKPGKQQTSAPPSRTVLLATIAAAAAACVYLGTIGADFVYDDLYQIATDDYIHKPAHFADVITLSVLSKDVLDNNRPVMLLSLMLDSLLWGRNAAGYHLTNLLLHILCTLLLFLVTRGVLLRLERRGDKPIHPLVGAFAAALLFAVHPLNSEAVCVVTFREDLLAAFFTLLALYLAGRFPAEKRFTTVMTGTGIVLSAFAATAAKENGIVAAPALLAYWLIVRRRGQHRKWTAVIIASFVAAAGFVVARFALAPESEIFTTPPVYPGGSFAAMLKVQPRIWVFQLGQIFSPRLLCANQTAYTVRSITLAMAIITLCITVLFILLVVRRNAAAALGAALYWLALLPVSNLIPIYRPMADRYLYLPMAGACLFFGALICRRRIPTKQWLTILLIIAAVGLLVGLGLATIQRTVVWSTSRSLWEDTIRKNPYSYTGHDNLGFALFDAGEYEKAVPIFKQATWLGPREADPWAGLAITYDAMHRPDLAEEAFRKAVALDKCYGEFAGPKKTLLWEPRHAHKLQAIADRVLSKK